MNLLEVSDALWTGERSIDGDPVTSMMLGFGEIEPGVGYFASLGNVSAIETAKGLLLVDTSSLFTGPLAKSSIEGWTSEPLHTVVYTHGHVDHVMGIGAWGDTSGVQVLAHENCPRRFDRYKRTAGYNGRINARQFRTPGLQWPTEYRYPDETLSDHRTLDLGGETFELHHDRGETDDHVWMWWPARRLLCTGDLFIWASPNCGNPQKAQRYPWEWACALRKMAALRPKMLLPGHGVPIVGEDRVERALTETAELLESLCEQVLSKMNEGAPLAEIVHSVEAPEHLLARPYLRPIYDEPEFVVQNLWRLWGGWWDGDPSSLKPAAPDTLAAEIAALAGGASVLIERATTLSEAGDHRLACHLAEMATRASNDPAIRKRRGEIYAKRAETERSLMARSIFRAASED